MASVPVTRFQVRTMRSQGGITVRLSHDDPSSVVIRFFDREGIDVDEAIQRKIERLFYREDYRRALAAEIGDIGFAPRALEYYTAALMDTVDGDAITGFGFKVVLDYAYGSTSFVMPNVLAKLGADVLAVNPYASTSGAAAFDRASHAAGVADLVRASGAHLGAVLDPGGERLTLVDDSGRVLTDDEGLLAILTLVCTALDKPKVALPVSVSQVAERICEDAGAEIIWTKLSTSHLMEVSRSSGVAFAASQEGGYIFPSFLPAYDAAATMVHLLGLLAETGLRLSKVTEQLAATHVAHESVVTPWEQKGMVMRTLVELGGRGRDLVLVDGVKVMHEGGWALVLPDPEEPLTHVWAEGPSDAEARSLAQEYARRIRQLLR
jgi:mannose-1-phosphate guanylyltransferase/phosphomannomutase